VKIMEIMCVMALRDIIRVWKTHIELSQAIAMLTAYTTTDSDILSCIEDFLDSPNDVNAKDIEITVINKLSVHGLNQGDHHV
jgi:hypothetical protein